MANPNINIKVHVQYRTKDGKRAPGVTTITGCYWPFQKQKAMGGWWTKQGAEGLDPDASRDNAAAMGTCAHILAVADLMGQEVDLRDFTPNQVDAAENALVSWYNWREGKKIIPILCETPLVSEVHRFGGTMDIYAEIDGKLTLLDLKTSGGIYKEHKTQVGGGYTLLLEEHGHKIDVAQILRIGRDESEGYEVQTINNIPACQEHFINLRRAYDSEKAVG
jgi:hypothetical protein